MIFQSAVTQAQNRWSAALSAWRRLDGRGLLCGNVHDMICVKEVSESVWMKLAQDLALGFCYQIMVVWDVTTCSLVDMYQLAAVIFRV
jgi:hypothetical protein